MTDIDYIEIVDSILNDEKYSRENVNIYGGRISQNEIMKITKKIDQERMPYIINEEFSKISINKGFSNDEIRPELVARLRIFGQCGDLEIRRDENDIFWRFIGEKDLFSLERGENFWDACETNSEPKKFFVEEKEALLWGEKTSSKTAGEERIECFDNRVAGANLVYPIKNKKDISRVKIIYRTLSTEGKVSFVWYLSLKGVNENGKRI